MPRRQKPTVEFTTLHLTIVGGLVLAASGFVFLLGIYVGRGLPTHHAGLDEQVARIPISEAPRMLEVERGPMPPAAPAQRPIVVDRPAAPSETADIAETAGPAEPVDPTGPAEPSGVIGDAIAAATAPRSAPADRAETTDSDTASGPAGPAVQAGLPPLPREPPVLEAPPGPAAVPYTVQVLATRNRDEADTLAQGLKRRRIGAFVSEVEDTGGNWYRVRIGIYDDLVSAQVMEARLRKLGLQQAYVSRYR